MQKGQATKIVCPFLRQVKIPFDDRYLNSAEFYHKHFSARCSDFPDPQK